MSPMLLGPIYSQAAPAPGTVAFTGDSVTGYLKAAWIISFDGLIYQRTGIGAAALSATGNWINPQVGMSLYECMATPLDLNPPQGQYGVWLDLAQSWSWSFDLTVGVARSESGGGTIVYGNDKNGTFQLQIRRKSDQVVVATGNVNIDCAGNA